MTIAVETIQEPALLRVEEAARRLGLSRSKTYSLVLTGELPSVSIGRSRRVRTADLERWIEGLRGDPAAA